MRSLILASVLLSAALLAPYDAQGQQTASASNEGRKTKPVVSFVLYYYHFQGDPKRQPPGLNVRAKDGSSLLVHTPPEGIGPWFSGTRVSWHRSQLEEIGKVGADSALVVWRPSRDSRVWSVPGLAAMVQALKELRSLRREYPLISAYIDLNLPEDQKLDLNTEAGKALLYTFIQEFFQLVPPDLRFRVPLPNTPPQDAAAVVVLGNANTANGRANGLTADIKRKFLQEFGHPLVVAGTQEWVERGAELDAVVPLDAKNASETGTAGLFTTAVVSPNSPQAAESASGFKPRNAGRSMIERWNSLYKSPPDWVIINSWNGYHDGTEVAPSRQHGDREQNLVMAALAALNRDGDFGARLLSLEAPKYMRPRTVNRVQMRIRNTGTRTWIRGGAALRYIWRKNGQPIDASGQLAVQRDVQPRRTETLSIGVATVNRTAEPLPEGEYELAFELVPSPGANPITLVSLPVQVKSEGMDEGAYLAGSSTPCIMGSGKTYSSELRIRNGSAQSWPKGLWYVAYRWAKNGTPIGGDADAAKIPALVDLEPGGVAAVEATVTANGPDGHPLPPSTLNQNTAYTLLWDVITPDGKRLHAGEETVYVIQNDPGVHFPFAPGVGSTLDADTLYTVKAVLRNIGPDTWQPGEVKVGYHWYYWDGLELIGNGPASPVEFPMGELKPGEEVLVRVAVRTPPFAGLFVLALDAQRGGKWASEGDVSRGTDFGLAYVFVRKGPFLPAHLEGQFDLDGVSFETAPDDGDFDGQGRTFPAELLPPEVAAANVKSNVYPCGYLTSAQGQGLDSSRRIVFQYPEKRDGAPNFIICRGQTLNLNAPRCSKVHILAAALRDTDADFALDFDDGTTLEQRVTMTAWDSKPRFGGHVAFWAPYRYSKTGGIENVPCYLVHYELNADSKRTLNALKLPNNPLVRIMALTVESW